MKALIKGYEDRFGRAVIYIMFLLFSLLAAAVLFGLLHSSGIIKFATDAYIKEAEFGGAAALFALTFYFMIYSYNNAEPEQASISGNIYNEQGYALEAVKIRINGALGSTSSDENGFYLLKLDASQDSWSLVAEHLDYAPLHQDLTKTDIRKPISLSLKKN
ncbi:peptidase associated/transthyretin-like domain-containing protein [Candidatus Venteria ishoeyi]|uniref:Carboxypeptidase-like regulatory domain-containing protein n=1 Tax=Candidatus Venteria ishoeyi TaxID=1899563 RepID=A0A1H6F3B9_9GAMM|nr:hypothetical protein [Candidatus Venteria ishoeyi]SEH04668.1 Uncharacterised protein [Candidatus Venteria ishoeyi]